MRYILCLAVALFWSASAAAADFSADMGPFADVLAADKSYSPEERKAAEAAFADLEAKANDISPAAFQLAVAHIAALAHNGHTMLLAGAWQHQFNRTALQYHQFADGLYVVGGPDAMHDLVGARVIAIDGRSAADLVKAFGDYFGGREGKRDEWAPFLLESPALLHAAGLAKADSHVEVTFETLNGRRMTLGLLAAMDPPKGELLEYLDYSRLLTMAKANVAGGMPFYLTSPERALLNAPMPELDAHYMHLRINKSFYDQKIETFMAEARAAIAKGKPKHLILDLRLDGGGDLNTTRDFMQALPTLAPGKIFVLTSGRTFSAAIASAGYLKQAASDRVVIVGEPIGDHLEFWAEGGIVKLPTSSAMLWYSTERHNYMSGCPEADCHSSIRDAPIRVQSLEPDITAPLTYADYRAGRDPALAAIKKILGK